MQTHLNPQEHQQYNKLSSIKNLITQQPALQLCLDYYKAYRKFVILPTDKIPLAFKCAFYMAEKSQYNVTVQVLFYIMKGQKIRAVSFSLNELLREHKLDDTMFMLKQMTKKIRFDDEETGSYLNNIVKEISFLITLHSKFEKTFTQKLQLKEREKTNDSSYVKTFTSFAWLLFITSKNQILHNSLELLPNTCMIASILVSILMVGWQSLKPQGLIKGEKFLNEKTMSKEASIMIQEKVLQIFCVKDMNEYGKIAQLFQGYLNRMIDHNFLKMSDNKLDFLSPTHLNKNYQKLDKYYEMTLKQNPQKLDQRIFFKERSMNLTPSKFTPFARQGYANKFQKQPLGGKLLNGKVNKQQNYNSHRILNYEAAQKEVQTRKMPISDIKLPKNIMQSPSMVKVPLIVTTPITAGMEMYNFLNQKRKRLQHINQSERCLDKQIFNLIDNVFNLDQKQTEVSKSTKKDMIVSLYKIYYEDYLTANPQQRDTPELLKAFLGLSIELVFFVSNISLSFEEIQIELQLCSLQMWKAITFFLGSDKSIPPAIKLRFLDLEVGLISYKIWQDFSIIEKLQNFINKNFKSLLETQINLMQKLFRRGLHQTAFQITKLSTSLDIQEKTSEIIFDTMKQIFANNPNIFYRRHFDQLIICCTYVLSKTPNRIIKFNEIKQRYVQTNSNIKSEDVDNMFAYVYIEQDQYEDIIYFYNQVFLKNQKLIDFVKMKKNTGMTPLHHYSKKNQILNSPLRDIIPKQFGFKSKGLQPKTKNGMTPQSQLLFAYNESPILKYEVSSFKGPIKNKKILNYDQVQQNLKSRACEQQTGTPTLKPTTDNNIAFSNFSNPISSQATNDFITKKYARKSTTPTNGPTSTKAYMTQPSHPQIQLNLQQSTKLKQNQTPISSHRTLFDDKGVNNVQNYEQKRYFSKKYQFGYK